MPTARGPLEVTTEPQPPVIDHDGVKINHNQVRKVFSGDLSGTSEAHMVAALTAQQGSAGYVAIEHFTGTIDGREGSFVLQHSGTMDKGDPTSIVTIVPDSGTGGLQGISGALEIDNDEGVHSYALEYEIR